MSRALSRRCIAYHLLSLSTPALAAFVAPPAHRRAASSGGGRSPPVQACEGQRTRTRFAPSPTGSLHVGGARTALFSWLKSQQDSGDFIVRVEDTDTARSTRESEAEVLEDLRWLGLEWAEGPIVGGPKGPYRQSERMLGSVYKDLADKLLASGDAYPCFCTAEELEAKRAAAEAAGENPQYDGTWRDADPDEVAAKMAEGVPYTVRYKVPRGKRVTINDMVRGEVSWDVGQTVGDFILLRSGGMPVYNFCVAVDDALMGISTVIRAEEHLTNTVRQVLVLESLGYDVPRYAHLALVLGEDRSKLSKRHGATSVSQFRREGFLPEAMTNYLCLLGWNDNTDQEIYSTGELVDAFSLDRVTKSPAVFDMAKLRWVNGQHLRALPEERLSTLLADHLAEQGLTLAADGAASSPFIAAASSMVREKIELVNDAAPLVRSALEYPLAASLADDKGAKGLVDGGFAEFGRAVLAAHKSGAMPDCSSDDFAAEWKAFVKGLGKELGLKGKGLFQPMRLAATGRMSGPDIPAQLRLVALASTQEGAEAASLAVDLPARMAALEKALAEMPAPVEA